MDLESNKALIRHWLQIAESGFDGDFLEHFASDYRGHLSGQPPQSLDDLIQLERAFATSFSNASYVIDDLFAVDDKVVLRLTTCATHTGPFYGIKPTNRRVSFTGIVIYRVTGGKIAESWGELDLLGLFRKIRT